LGERRQRIGAANASGSINLHAVKPTRCARSIGSTTALYGTSPAPAISISEPG